MLRHMLVHERATSCTCFAAVPDWWLDDGREIRIERAPTHFGEMSLLVRGTKEGVQIKLDPPKRNPPKKIVLRLPRSRPLLETPAGIEVVERPDQKQRWDYPSIVELFLRQNPRPSSP